jgi:hypothetical protein
VVVLIALGLAYVFGVFEPASPEAPHDRWGGRTPTDLTHAVARRDGAAIDRLSRERLDARLGSAFPFEDLRVHADHEERLASLAGKSVAFAWIAEGGCPAAKSFLETPDADRWHTRDFDELVYLVTVHADRFLPADRDRSKEIRVDWPFDGYLVYVHYTPTFVYVDDQGRFVGYLWGKDPTWWSGRERREGP